ncbi:MAG: DNA polymerase IV [Planctomycetes bacterium]|nr:DNA polymerase IV [Planctomycetota bacterium]
MSPAQEPPEDRAALDHAFGRVIAHLDIDAFLASVEQAHDPRLRGKAVIVGGRPTDRNLVMSCSYAARALGIKPGMLLPQAARIARRAGVRAVFLPGSSIRANAARESVLRAVRGFTPLVEATSIDDAYADLGGTLRLHGAGPLDLGERIARAVREASGLAISMGLGSNRLIARLATRLAKPGGVAWVRPEQETAFVAAIALEALPGIGSSIGGFLRDTGLRTAGDLQRVPRETLEATFGRHGAKLYERCRGIDRTPVRPERLPAAIHRETTFPTPTADLAEVRAMLAYLVDRACARLRALSRLQRANEAGACALDAHRVAEQALDASRFDERALGASDHGERALGARQLDERALGARQLDERALGARRLSVRLVYADRAEPPAQRTLKEPTHATTTLRAIALELLERLATRRVLVRRVGLSLSGFAPAPPAQATLFEEGDARRARLDRTVDAIRARHGFGRLVAGPAVELLGKLENPPDGFVLRTPSLTQ